METLLAVCIATVLEVGAMHVPARSRDCLFECQRGSREVTVKQGGRRGHGILGVHRLARCGL